MILEIYDPMRKHDGPSFESVSCTDNLILICITVNDIFKLSCSLCYKIIQPEITLLCFSRENTEPFDLHTWNEISEIQWKFSVFRDLDFTKEIKEI